MTAALGLAGKHVLLTGASRGIGLGLADAFAAAGADLAVLADDPAILAVAERLARRHGQRVRGWVCDITDRAGVAAVVAAAADGRGLDVLINNAGLELITPVDDPDPEVDQRFARIIEINVIGTWNVTRAALPALADGGRIINTASVWGKSAVAAFAAYVASKHAVIGLTRTFAKELGPRRITVNAVCPGWVETAAALRSLAVMAERSGRSEAALQGEITAAQCLPGLMQPADITGLYLFLASDLAANITGQALGIDRGEFPG